MEKFILIDQSIKGLGGHYLEYATHVLDAAAKKGMKPCIATNKAFKGKVPYQCFPVYNYDIWGDSNFKNKLKTKKRQLKNGLNCAIWPVKKIARQFKSVIKRRGCPVKRKIDSNKKILKAKLSLFSSKLYFSEYGYFLSLLGEKNFIVMIVKINPIKFILFFVISFFGACIAFLFKTFKTVVAFVRQTINAVKEIVITGTLYLHKTLWRNSFKRKTNKVIKHYNADENDIIFIPTLSNTDLSGLKSLIKKNRKAQRASWHLVFRRNLFIGREPDYKNYQKDKDELREITYECAIKKEYGKMFFYTDTEKLTEQYDSMHTVTFSTLPIPVNPKLEENRPFDDSKPKNIIYLGDARREKGYQELPGIVDSLWDGYVEKGKVRFEFQSNFSFTNMDANCDIVAARDYMEILSDNHVKLYKKPLSSEEYLTLAKSGDIALLFYDRENYYARSSGALVECMIAGIPVLVPSGSWLSEQICYENYQHLNKVIVNSNKKVTNLGSELRWNNNSTAVNLNPMQNEILSFGTGENAAYSFIKVPKGTTTIFISYFVNDLLPKGNFVKAQIIDLREKEHILYESDDYATRSDDCKVVVAYNLKELLDTVKIQFSNAFSQNAISITDLEISFALEGQECILGESGVTFSRYEDVSLLLENMLNYYPYYMLSAKQKANKSKGFHNAGRLVDELCRNAKEVSTYG